MLVIVMREKDILFSNNNIMISQYNFFCCKIYILKNCNDNIIFVNIAQNMRSLKQENCTMISNKIVKILFLFSSNNNNYVNKL